MPKQALTKRILPALALYGKIPAHGDFISRGLQRCSASELDSWLTTWLELSKTVWGVSFEGNYRAAQPWIFSGNLLTAIVIPSFDRVERLFPLFICVGAGARVQDLYDAAFSAIAEMQTGDQLFETIKIIECGDKNSSVETEAIAGWFLPDPKEIAMPHPFFGDESDWVRGAMQ